MLIHLHEGFIIISLQLRVSSRCLMKHVGLYIEMSHSKVTKRQQFLVSGHYTELILYTLHL